MNEPTPDYQPSSSSEKQQPSYNTKTGDMDSLPVSNKAAGEPESLTNKTLETGAAALQNFAPVERICAHLNAFHVYADEPGRYVEANHYCSHLNDEVRQCILYDSPTPPARIIGIGMLIFPLHSREANEVPEYMITPKLYETLDADEQKLWHSHVFEVKSGMLIMPKPTAVPEAVWEVAENKEMEQVVELYGKVYHLWQVSTILQSLRQVANSDGSIWSSSKTID